MNFYALPWFINQAWSLFLLLSHLSQPLQYLLGCCRQVAVGAHVHKCNLFVALSLQWLWLSRLTLPPDQIETSESWFFPQPGGPNLTLKRQRSAKLHNVSLFLLLSSLNEWKHAYLLIFQNFRNTNAQYLRCGCTTGWSRGALQRKQFSKSV